MSDSPSQKASILIVEDNDLLGDIILTKLTGSGYQAQLARDGLSALKRIEEGKFDLVLLDIVLPLMDGYEILEHMRKDPATANTAVIIISNSGQPVELERLRALGVKDYLIKADFTPEEVLKKIRSQLGEPAEYTWPEHFSMLVVEDDPFLKDLLSKKIGVTTNALYAMDGEEAIKLVAEKHPSLILLDILLPGIDGFEVLRQVRADPANKETIIIVLSNFNQDYDIKKAKDLGADDYLVKSNYTIDEVLTKVREHIAKKYPNFKA
jgi:CheY-like chemotaxis protein